MNKKKEIKALKGQIVYSESSKKLKICENGYLVYEANQIKGVYPFSQIFNFFEDSEYTI